MLVHAHPDDETIGQGATMASYAARGTGVTLVTCTLGEEGEVLLPDMAHLAADQDDALGEHRITDVGGRSLTGRALVAFGKQAESTSSRNADHAF